MHKLVLLLSHVGKAYIIVPAILAMGIAGFAIVKAKLKKGTDKVKKLTFIQKIINIFKPNIYSKYFREFTRSLPFKFRYSVLNRKQFLYLNITNDNLIKKSTDFESFSYQYFPNHKLNDTYNFYLTSNSVISELRKNLVFDNETETNRHLLKFWRKIYKHQKPTILLAVDYKEIIKLSANNDTTETTLSIRKKLNLLYQAIKEKCKIYLCIANLNCETGFDHLTDFIKKNDYPYCVTASHPDELIELFRKEISIYSQNISKLLKYNEKSLPSITAINCLNIISSIGENLNSFISKITFHDGVLTAPEINGIFISAYNRELSPFSKLYTKPVLNYARRNYLLSAIGILALLFILKSIETTNAIVKNGEKKIADNNKQDISVNVDQESIVDTSLQLMNATKDQLNSSIWSSIYPSDIAMSDIHKEIADQIYTDLLLPELTNTNNAEQALFLIFLAESNYSGSLQHLILKNSAKWSSEINLKPEIIEDYVKYNSKKRFTSVKGSTAYLSEDCIAGLKQNYQYLLNLYDDLGSDPNINIDDINNFLNFYYHYYNRRITVDLLLHKYYPAIQSSLSSSVNNFISRYHKLLHSSIATGDDSDTKFLLNSMNDFGKVNYKVETDIQSFNQLVEAINKVVVNLDNSNNENKKIVVGSPGQLIKDKTWDQIVAVAKINTLLENYFKSPEKYHTLFSRDAEKAFIPIELNDDNNGQYIFTGKCTVPGIYTKLAVNSVLIPNDKAFHKLIFELKPLGVKTELLNFQYDSLMKKYVNDYINNYVSLANSVSYNAASKDQLDVLLDQLSGPASPVLDLVNTVKDNTDFKVDKDNSFVLPIVNKFKPFHNLLPTKKKDKLGDNNIESYFSTLKKLQDRIDSQAPKGNPADNTRMELTELGHVASNILLDKKSSYLKSIDSWLNNINMPEDLRAPFTKPVITAYNLGVIDIKNSLDHVWNASMEPIIQQQKNLFPFNKNSIRDIDVKLFDSELSPAGSFWTLFDKYYKPYLIEKNNSWTLRTKVPYTPDIISADTLNQINSVYSMTSQLWDKNSNPKPLEIYLRPDELKENGLDDNDLIKMTYLNSGESEIIGINSVNFWHKLQIAWWQPVTSSTGIQLQDGNNCSVTENSGLFSFYRLLMQATNASKQTNSFRWQIGTNSGTNNKVTVGFKFKENPWGIFRI